MLMMNQPQHYTFLVVFYELVVSKILHDEFIVEFIAQTQPKIWFTEHKVDLLGETLHRSLLTFRYQIPFSRQS